jgi:U-box domain
MAPAFPKQFHSVVVSLRIPRKTNPKDVVALLKKEAKKALKDTKTITCWVVGVYRLPQSTHTRTKYLIYIFAQSDKKCSMLGWTKKRLGLNGFAASLFVAEQCKDDDKREAKILKCCGYEQSQGIMQKSPLFVDSQQLGNFDKLRVQWPDNDLPASISNDEIDGFTCIISKKIMEDPVITPAGHSYERAAFEKWIETNPTGK